MALTFGFYNSIEGDRKYDAIQFGRIFDGIITDGVYATYEKGMVVKASDNAGEVIIQPGRAWFNHTWNYNDADYVMEAPAPEVLLDRIDALVLDINEEQAVRENSFVWVTGAPSSNPVRPTLTNTTTHHQYPLCYVRRYAETTMIYTKDITSMVGTSECPFVTGVLEGMDIDAWINQWDNEFHTWEDATKVSFEAWMLTQQTDYTAWFNAVRDQLGTDMTEFEAWFETIKGIIDEEAATHLQAEIDEIKTMLPAGSHITITTTDTELFSRNVIIRDDFGHEITSKFDTSGVAVFETVPYVGSLTISSTDGIRTATNVVNTPYFARYEFQLAFWSATVNIEGDEDLAGYTVTVYNSEETVVSSIVLNAEAKGVFNATYPDEFIFRITYGGETMEVSLDVREETTYTVTLSAGFNWRTWCALGGVSTSGYSDLSDVFDDEVAVRRLMTVHASADYLIECVTRKLTTIDDFVANDTAMKWIGLRDYVCDGLTAITGVEAKFLASQYWERYLKDHVPVMTSNTAPYGEGIINNAYNSSVGYRAFDGDATTNSMVTAGANARIGFKFTNPVSVKKVAVQNRRAVSTGNPLTYKIIASNDGATWEDLTGVITNSNPTSTSFIEVHEISNDNYYLYYAINPLTANNDTVANIATLQFYGRALDVSVPVMTSNTAPYGVAFDYYNSSTSGAEAYHVFANDDIAWGSVYTKTTSGGEYVGYHFISPVKINAFYFKGRIYDQYYQTQSFKIQASNNGSDWVDVSDVYTISDGVYKRYDFDNDTEYSYYRLYFTASNTLYQGYYTSVVNSLQFYGVDYSEREFASGSTMKYLYDHGVELETLNVGSSVSKEDTQILCSSNPTDGASTVASTNNIDLLQYRLLRAVIGDKYVKSDGQAGAVFVSNQDTIQWDSTTWLMYKTVADIVNPYSDVSVDITSITQSKKVAFGSGKTSSTTLRRISFKELWLE